MTIKIDRFFMFLYPGDKSEYSVVDWRLDIFGKYGTIRNSPWHRTRKQLGCELHGRRPIDEANLDSCGLFW